MKDLPNIVLIVLDTLRRDTLEQNLHKLPNFQELLKSSHYFTNAISPASWTIPSHCSMLTGSYPIEHGMTYKFDDEDFFQSISKIPDRFATIQARLHKMGYKAVSIAANPLVGEGSAFEFGFDLVESVGPFSIEERIGKEMKELVGISDRGFLQTIWEGTSKKDLIRKIGISKATKLLKLNRQRKRGLKRLNFPVEKGYRQVFERFSSSIQEKPYFAFMNLMEMHEPYTSISDFESIERDFLRARLKKGGISLDSHIREINQSIESLVNDLKLTDEFLGRVIYRLKEEGNYRDSIIVVTSDHGQSFGEDGFVGHGYLLNDALVNVPLIIKTDTNVKAVDDAFRSTLDISNFLLGAVEDKSWAFPIDRYVFSEAFGRNRSKWEYSLGELSGEFKPEIRKRIWSQDGNSLTVNGTSGTIEEFRLKGKKSEPIANAAVVSELTDEMAIFVGNSSFNMPAVL